MVTQAQGKHDLTLAEVRPGTRVRLARTTVGRGLLRRLSDMGLRLGTEVEVVHRHGGGCVVVAHGSTRVALGGGMAAKVVVEPAGPPPVPDSAFGALAAE